MMFKSRHTIRRVFQICIHNISCRHKPERYQSFKPFLLQTSYFSNTTIKRECEEITEFETPQPPYRGISAINLQDNATRNLLTEKENVTENDWAKLFAELSNIEFPIFIEQSRDLRNLEICYSLKKLNAARTYLIHMKKIGKKFNCAVVSVFIKICYECREECTKGDLEIVKKFTNYLKTNYSSVMDNAIAEPIIKGLCLADNWEQCGNILEELFKLQRPNAAVRGACIICFLNCNQLELALKMVKESFADKILLDDNVLIKLLNALKNDPQKIIEILKSFQDSDLMPQKSICYHLIKLFSSFPEPYRLKGIFVNIEDNGKCSNCKQKLPEVEISKNEFETLRETFLNKVLIGTDVFKTSTPEELESFFKCVEKNAPFDVIIDGLNVIYSSGVKSYSVYARLLTDTVKHFVKRGQKVFVVGRKHMNDFPSRSLKYVRENSTLFLVDDLTKDDMYMIYATLYSGMDAVFVTRDFLRTEKFKLVDTELWNVFKRWQLSRQLYIKYISPSGDLHLKNLCKFQMNVQSSKEGWHIPYNSTESIQPAEEYGVHEHWLCLKK